MPQPPDVEALHARLRAVYAQAWAELVAQQRRIENEFPRLLRRSERLARLKQLERSVERTAAMLDRAATVYATSDFPKAYAMGTIVVDPGFVWTSEHLAAVSQMAADLHTDLLHATRYMRRSAKETIRALVPDRAVAALLAGSTAQEQGRIAAELFADHGLTGVVYRDGSRRSLADYADMVLRTKTAHAYNGGTVNYGRQQGVEVFEVFDGPSCGWLSHDDAVLANGLIVTGNQALGNPSSHPRCQRSYGARPDLKRRHAGSRDSTQTPEQARDSAAAELARQAAQDRRRALSAARAGRAAPPSYVARTRALRASRAQRSRAGR